LKIRQEYPASISSALIGENKRLAQMPNMGSTLIRLLLDSSDPTIAGGPISGGIAAYGRRLTVQKYGRPLPPHQGSRPAFLSG